MRAHGSNEVEPIMEKEHFTPEEVEKYLAHIHYAGPIEPTIEALTELQRCHILSVPFENLSVYGKESIVLTKDWLFDKMMQRNRGGFCYELNRIFSLLLDHFGFKHKLHAASVFHYKTGNLSPPSHVVLSVDIGDDVWLSDVGFGYCSFPPLRLSGLLDGQVQQSGPDRVRRHGGHYIFEERIRMVVDELGREKGAKERFTSEDDPDWVPRYKFDLIPQTIKDFHDWLIYHQTDPRSLFTHDRICTIAKPWGRITLSGNKFVTSAYLADNRVKKTRKVLAAEEEVVKELEEKFGIKRDACLYPEGSMFCRGGWNKTF